MCRSAANIGGLRSGTAPLVHDAAPSATPRLQIGSIFASYGVAGFFWGSFVATLPAYQIITGLAPTAFGVLLASVTVGGILAMQILGRVLHRVQAVAIPACLVAMGLGMMGLGSALGPVSFGLWLGFCGAASGGLDISLNMRVARIEQDLGVSLFNRVHALFPFSMLVTSALVGLARQGGATPAMILPVLGVFLLIVAMVEYRAGAHQRVASGVARPGGRVRLGRVIVALGCLAGLGAMMEGGAHTWSALYVEQGLSAGPAMGGFAAAAITLGLTTGRLVAHRFDNRMRPLSLLRVSVLGALPALAFLALVPVPMAALLGFFLTGMAIGPVEPAVFRSVARRHDEATRGQALALATGVAYGGYLLSPPVMGVVIDTFGWPAMWGALGVISLAASALASRIPPAK